MVQRQLTLSDDANEFIQQQLATGQFASPDEVVSKTLEEAQIAAAKKKLAELEDEKAALKQSQLIRWKNFVGG